MTMLAVAKKAAREGGEILSHYFLNPPPVKYKNRAKTDLVTRADKESEKMIKKIILNHFPGHGFWGEETGQFATDREYVWVVDPLDGTTNFTLHIPLFSVSIGLLQHGEPVLGVIYIPAVNELIWAKKNQGAARNGKPIFVSKTNKLKDSICCVEYWSRDTAHQKRGLADFSYYAQNTKKIRYLSSAAFELCRVATGDLDFCILDTTFIDIAAAALIIKEAGGRCSGIQNPFRGEPSGPFRLIASNQNLHPTLTPH